MAKSAKHRDPEVTGKALKQLRHVHDLYEQIETARGRYMNTARRYREQMTTAYEALAALGISQRVSKLNVKIDRALKRINGWQADLEIEERRMAQKLARAQEDKLQLSLWAELPKPTKAELKAAKADNVVELTQPAQAAEYNREQGNEDTSRRGTLSYDVKRGTGGTCG